MDTQNTENKQAPTRSVGCEAALLYSAHFLPGAGRRGGSVWVGVVHAVKPLGCNGDNFNEALCGKKPGRKSLGWQESSGDITCPKCRKALGI